MKVRSQKRTNPIAKNLRTPLYRKRIVQSKKVYTRKEKPDVDINRRSDVV